MATNRLPRLRDPVQLGKLIVDILSGQVMDAAQDGKDAAAAAMGRKGAAARAKKLTPRQRADMHEWQPKRAGGKARQPLDGGLPQS